MKIIFNELALIMLNHLTFKAKHKVYQAINGLCKILSAKVWISV